MTRKKILRDYEGGINLDADGKPKAEAYVRLKTRNCNGTRLFGVVRGTCHTIERWTQNGWVSTKHCFGIWGVKDDMATRKALREQAPELYEYLHKGGVVSFFPAEDAQDFFDIDFDAYAWECG